MGYVLAVVEALRAIGIVLTPEEIVDDKWRRANPCDAAVYHRALARTLPWWHPLWKLREFMRAMQWQALCAAVDRERCDEVAETVVRKIRATKRQRQRTLRVSREDSGAGVLPSPDPPDDRRRRARKT
jgi:hypothetical protein